MRIDNSKLNKRYQLMVQRITFASTEIGDPTNGRTAATAVWAVADNVTFKGKLESILIFGLMAFELTGLDIGEAFTLLPLAEVDDVQNISDLDVPTFVELDPEGLEMIVLAEDAAFLGELINGKSSWSAQFDVTLQDKATSLINEFFYGNLLQLLAGSLRYDLTTPGSEAPLYTLQNYSLLKRGATKLNTTWLPIDDDTEGMATYEPASQTLGVLILQA